MDFSNDSYENCGSAVFDIDSLDMVSISDYSFDESSNFTEDSLEIFRRSASKSITRDSLDQSFSSHDLLMVVQGSVGQGANQLVFDLPDFFQPLCTSEKLATFKTPTAKLMMETIQSLTSLFPGVFGVFPAKLVHVQRVVIKASKVDTKSTLIVFGFLQNHVSAFASEYNINSMVLSSRIFSSLQLKSMEDEIQDTRQALTISPCKESCFSTTDKRVHLYPQVFAINSSGALQRIDVNIRALTSTSTKVIERVDDVHIDGQQFEVLESCSVKYTTRKPKNIFRRFARWFRKRSSALKCF